VRGSAHAQLAGPEGAEGDAEGDAEGGESTADGHAAAAAEVAGGDITADGARSAPPVILLGLFASRGCKPSRRNLVSEVNQRVQAAAAADGMHFLDLEHALGSTPVSIDAVGNGILGGKIASAAGDAAAEGRGLAPRASSRGALQRAASSTQDGMGSAVPMDTMGVPQMAMADAVHLNELGCHRMALAVASKLSEVLG